MAEENSIVSPPGEKTPIGLYSWRRIIAWALAVIMFVVLPVVWIALLKPMAFIVILGLLLRFLAALLFFVALAIFANIFTRKIFIGVFFSAIAWVYYLILYALLAYWSITKEPLDIYFLLDTIHDAYRFALAAIDFRLSISILLFVIVYSSAFAFCFKELLRFTRALLDENVPKRSTAIPSVLFCIVLLSFAHAHILNELQLFHTQRNSFIEIAHAIIPDNGIYKPANGESIFIVQLESQNALALNGDAEVDGRSYNGDFMPQEKIISKNGFFFPYFWSNSIQTNRAQESMFCGIVNNLGRGLSVTPDAIKTQCLPAILRDAGYNTVALRADDLEITNFRDFFTTVGFTEMHQKDIMHENETGGIGYDDCLFYERSIEFLKNKYPDPSKNLFVYLEVSNNHYPFTERGYDVPRKFQNPKNFVERYLNSSLEQDYCFEKFYGAFKEYSKGKMHLLVLSDNSWPVGIGGSSLNAYGAHAEQFLIPMTYIPPDSRKKEFSIGREILRRFSQSDLLPSVIELLGGGNHQNSFIPFLRGKTGKYEDCQVLTQPYGGGKIALAKGNEYFVYSLDSGELVNYDTKHDFLLRNPVVIGNISYESFMREYFCKRYQ
ncbi:MAG: sulfatase-like hydrolase/transferase [Candidatus Peribacteraceae bacterium]|nr:sulfatase-like hydrolase/transferase [Candidatus Peribacteraceae bacterium]MDD5075041.1 sulfatase-like hydrolase/transferase [Candidatus Peribacteraceae bacterium]